MILLFGGTSETSIMAQALAEAGCDVLVSTATDIPLDIGHHPRIEHRVGKMSEDGIRELIRVRKISAIVSVSHPYAENLHRTLAAVATKIPCFTYLRPEILKDREDCLHAQSHEEAAVLACELGRPVLLTTGSRNLIPYVQESEKTCVLLYTRVLDQSASHQACAEAGIPPERVITGRGPFSVEENRRLIRQFSIGVLVTKDSGEAGGVREKMEAARLEGCLVVIVARPVVKSDFIYHDIEELITALKKHLRLEVVS